MDERKLTPANIRALGILWALNKHVLHPNGWALGIDDETSEFTIYGDGTEPWSFDEESDKAGEQKFQNFINKKRCAGGIHVSPHKGCILR